MGMLKGGGGPSAARSTSQQIHAPLAAKTVRVAVMKPKDGRARQRVTLAALAAAESWVTHEGRTLRVWLPSLGLRTKDGELTAIADEDWLEVATDSLKDSAEALAKEAVLMAEAAAKVSAGGDRIDRVNSENQSLLDALVSG